MHKWHFAEHEDPKIPLYKVSVHSDFVICQLLLAFFSVPLLILLKTAAC